MELRLSDHYAAADVDGDLVFLDRRDFSFHIAPNINAQISPGPSNLTWNVSDAQVAANLIEAGIYTSAHWQATTKGRHIAGVQASVCSDDPQPLTWRDRIDMAASWFAMLRHYRGRRFDHLLKVASEHVIPLDHLAEAMPPPELIQRVRRFERMFVWTPLQGQCLYRSLMLLLFLRRGGHDAMWVFGVRTWPFIAHCWLQVGDVALNEAADGLVSFRPILVA